jgi:hypothetical protein
VGRADQLQAGGEVRARGEEQVVQGEDLGDVLAYAVGVRGGERVAGDPCLDEEDRGEDAGACLEAIPVEGDDVEFGGLSASSIACSISGRAEVRSRPVVRADAPAGANPGSSSLMPVTSPSTVAAIGPMVSRLGRQRPDSARGHPAVGGLQARRVGRRTW